MLNFQGVEVKPQILHKNMHTRSHRTSPVPRNVYGTVWEQRSREEDASGGDPIDRRGFR